MYLLKYNYQINISLIQLKEWSVQKYFYDITKIFLRHWYILFQLNFSPVDTTAFSTVCMSIWIYPLCIWNILHVYEERSSTMRSTRNEPGDSFGIFNKPDGNIVPRSFVDSPDSGTSGTFNARNSSRARTPATRGEEEKKRSCEYIFRSIPPYYLITAFNCFLERDIFATRTILGGMALCCWKIFPSTEKK